MRKSKREQRIEAVVREMHLTESKLCANSFNPAIVHDSRVRIGVLLKVLNMLQDDTFLKAMEYAFGLRGEDNVQNQ